MPEPVGERVHQRGKIEALAAQTIEALALRRRHRLDQRGDQRHRRDAEPGLDGLDLRRQ